VSADGRLSAKHPGEAVVACGAKTATSAIVFELVGLALDRISDWRYDVRPLIYSTINVPTDRELIFADDITYRCLWDASECGDAAYDGGSCLLTFKSPRLCPVVSTLKVTAVSRALNLSVSGSATIVRSNPWGRTDIVVRLPYGNSTKVPIYGKVRQEDVQPADTPPKGIDWNIDDTQPGVLTLTLSATGGYDEETTLTLLDTASREKLRIFISPTGEFAGVRKTVDPTESWLFYLSVVMTFLLTGYIVTKLGARRLLPPLSPYRPPR
jgi:hypothetical protein